jgi:short subunit dehydrogenase-like uncharacterized protein
VLQDPVRILNRIILLHNYYCLCLEPGYICTSKIVTNCALVLLRESEKIPVKGGVITPAIAFSNTSLIDRLNADGILFENISKLNSNL